MRRIAFSVALLPALLFFVGCSEGPEGETGDELDVISLSSGALRVATFNAAMNRPAAGDLIEELSTSESEQANAIAEIIQIANPHIILVNEFDWDTGGEAATLFEQNYLEVGQGAQPAIKFPYRYLPTVNTGEPSGVDLNSDGAVGGPDDAYGFGDFPGQFGMVIWSKLPLKDEQIRTFQTFKWASVPNAEWPDNPDTDAPGDFFSEEAKSALRLTSKNHVDLPFVWKEQTVHLLAQHPTPPAFDGPEDKNGLRNYAEIRFFADYLSAETSGYIVDDAGQAGGLGEGSHFVMVGDHNADPVDGSSRPGTIDQLLGHPAVNALRTPSSQGAPIDAAEQGLINAEHKGNPAFDTSDFGDKTVGNLRLDYALPSKTFEIKKSGVFWPKPTSIYYPLIKHSDHRLVFVDLKLN